MKKIVLMALAIIMNVMAFADDYTLYIVANSTASHKISTIQKLTFEDGNVVVNFKDGSKESTAISLVSKMYFEASTTEVEDVNQDGKIDTQDVLQIYNYIQDSTSSTGEQEDVNQDNTVDTQDVLKVYEYIQNN